MESRALGQSGVSVSTIGLGGYELGGRSEDVSSARAVIRASLESGVNWIDTAQEYHGTGNETVIGEAIKGVAATVQIASKAFPENDGFRPERVLADCRMSLARLGVEHLDAFFLHWPDDPAGVPLAETWGAMAELADQGLVRAIGLSNFTLEQVDACHAARRVDVVQEGLSLIDHLHNVEYVAACAKRGIAAVMYKPLAGGILGGPIAGDADMRERFGDDVVEWDFYPRLYAPGRIERSATVAEGVTRVAARLGAHPSQVAIAWVLAQPGVTAAICGTRSPAHARANAEATRLELDAETVGELARLIPLGPTYG